MEKWQKIRTEWRRLVKRYIHIFQIEFAVGPLCRRVSDLGKSYKLLRSFRYYHKTMVMIHYYNYN